MPRSSWNSTAPIGGPGVEYSSRVTLAVAALGFWTARPMAYGELNCGRISGPNVADAVVFVEKIGTAAAISGLALCPTEIPRRYEKYVSDDPSGFLTEMLTPSMTAADFA